MTLNHQPTVKGTAGHDKSQSSCGTCAKSDCSAKERKSGESAEEFEGRRKLHARLCRVQHKIVVLSGKGGVGKSTVAVNLATALQMAGKRVGLLDVDIHGPSIPTMLGIEHPELTVRDGDMLPVEADGLKVMSIGFLLQNQDDAVIWRGPMKLQVIRQFLQDVAWGDLDFLIVDSPPGTGDEPLSICQLIGNPDGALIVTTPQRVAAVDVRKSITFCRQINVPVLGVVENMSGFVCPKCGELTPILSTGGGQKIASDMAVPYLGAIPFDPLVTRTGDDGRPLVRFNPKSPTAKIVQRIFTPIVALDRRTA
jgi:Mrp family chromosome partitioning ATPase